MQQFPFDAWYAFAQVAKVRSLVRNDRTKNGWFGSDKVDALKVADGFDVPGVVEASV
jgi:hypothetical protein